MDKKILLILLLVISCIKAVGQSNDLLPDLRSDVRLMYLLDSARKAQIEIKKIDVVVVTNRLPPSGSQPLLLLKTDHEIFVLDSVEMLNPDWVTNVSVIDKQKLIGYGSGEKKGIILIAINDKSYPKAYKYIKSTFKRFKTN